MPMPRKPDPLKYCAFCGKALARKRFSNGKLESLLHFGRRKYCGRKCMAAAFDERDGTNVKASTGRYHARKKIPKGRCEVCGKPDALDVHHVDHDWNNNSKVNLQRICRSCHSKMHRKNKVCVICGDPHKGHGYCDKHYQRFKKWGDPMKVKPNQHSPVSVADD